MAEDYLHYYDNATAPDEAVMCSCCERNLPRNMLKAGRCSECFIEWYDGDRPTAMTRGKYDEHKMYSKAYIGNWVRKRHGLPPMEPTNG